MTRPKLLQINTALNWSATGKIAEQIIVLAKSLGWDCYTAHGARYVYGKSAAQDISTDFKLNDYWDAANTMFWGEHGLGSKRVTKNLIRAIDKVNPDIIHLHNVHGYYLNYQILFGYLARSRAKVVWTLHDCWAMTGHCTHFDEIGCEKWKTQCYDCPLLHTSYKSWFFDRSPSNYKRKKTAFTSVKNMTIVPVSEWLERIVKQSFLKNYPRQVIRNGVDLSIFRPTESELRRKLQIDDDKAVLLGVASGWGRSKGLEDFCRLGEINKFQVVLVGVSEKVEKQLLPSIIAVRRTTNQQELAAYYTMADIFVNPTHSDSFPTVNLEALACGTPVVTYRTGGSPEAIDENTGMAVEKGDFQALKSAIEVILQKGKGSYSEFCRKRAEQHFNKDERFADYIRLYEKILSSKSK